MGHINLSPEDQEKYGAPERLPFQYGRWGLRAVDALEANVIEVPVGEDEPRGWTVEDLHNAMRRKKTRNGQAVQVPIVDDEGTPVVGADGNPKMRDVIEPSRTAIAAVIWLALWANGIRIPWRTFDVDQVGLHIEWGDDDEGKAPIPED